MRTSAASPSWQTASTPSDWCKSIKVKVENTYADGHESIAIYEVDESGLPDTPADEGLEDLLYEFTGDGHAADTDLDASYEVTILESVNPTLVGRVMEWR